MNRNKQRRCTIGLIFVFLLFFIAFSGRKESEGTFLIKGAKIYTSSSIGTLREASLLIERGKIKKVIRAGKIPSVPVVDYSGKCIIPGIIDAHTCLSGYYRLLENTQPITSDLIAYAAFDPLSPEVQDALRSGITTVNFSPRNENLVGGISSVFKLSRKLEGLQFLKKEAFLKISFNGEVVREDRAPTSLMGAATILSEKMQKMKENNGRKREEIFKEEGLLKLVEGSLQPLVAASTYEEINTALEWLRRWNMKGVIVGGEEASYFSEYLKKRDIPVLLSPLLFSLPEKLAKNAALLLRKGVRAAFVSDMPEGDALGLRLSALLLYQQGISQEEALRTITLFPAQILGVEDSVGSLEEGKDADIVVLSGEPLDLSSKIVAVYFNGQLIFKKEK